MATLKTSTLLPDPTFYPSPKVAMQAAPEKLAFVSLPNPSQDGSSDALALVDVDPQSLKYGQIVGEMKAPLPGTNFTTSVGIRVAPGFVLILRIRTWSVVISSYRVCAHRPCCSVPATAGRPHTSHCGPDGIYINAIGSVNGDGPVPRKEWLNVDFFWAAAPMGTGAATLVM